MVNEKFLLDANSFITPYKNYYPFDFAPGYWGQLLTKLSLENVAIIDLVKEEVEKGKDELSVWLSSIKDLNICTRLDKQIMQKYAEILTYIQMSSLYTDRALRTWSQVGIADPWLIAVAAVNDFTLITFETAPGVISTPTGRPKIPEVARHFGVRCENLFYFMRKQNFRL